MHIHLSHRDGLIFTARNDDALSATFDASPEHGGGAALTPMESVLAALGGCSGMDVVSMLRNRGLHVTGYDIDVEAERAEEDPQVFTKIRVVHVLHGNGLNQTAVQQAVESSTNRYCAVLAMLKETAEVDVAFRIVEV